MHWKSSRLSPRIKVWWAPCRQLRLLWSPEQSRHVARGCSPAQQYHRLSRHTTENSWLRIAGEMFSDKLGWPIASARQSGHWAAIDVDCPVLPASTVWPERAVRSGRLDSCRSSIRGPGQKAPLADVCFGIPTITPVQLEVETAQRDVSTFAMRFEARDCSRRLPSGI
jgi:hypothetical protein